MIVASSAVVANSAVVASSVPLAGTEAEDGAWRLIEGFVEAIDGAPLDESALVYRGVAAGEYLAGLTYENAGADAQRLGSDVTIVYPEDGTSAVPDGVAILRGAPHPEAARRFVDFALGYDVARVVAARFKRRSVRVDAPPPEGLPPLESIRLVDYDFDAAVSEREETLDRFKRLTSSR